MLTIRKLTDSEISELKQNNKDSHFLGVIEDNVITEYVEYSASGDTLNVINITERKDNLALIDGLMRTLLFTTDPTAVKYITLPADYPLTAAMLGFKENGDGYVLKLEEFGNKCKG